MPKASIPPRPVHRARECFVCGTDNPAGLELGLAWDGARTRAIYEPKVRHRGYGAVVHGGIVAAMLDEAICVALGEQLEAKVVTVDLAIGFRRPVFVGRPVLVEGWHTRSAGRFHYGAGHVVDQASGKTCATGRIKCIVLPADRAGAFTARGA